MTVTLPKNARGPVVDLTLPASANPLDLILRNKTTGDQLTIDIPGAWAGDDLTLDFFGRTIKDQNGVDRSSMLNTEDNALWTPNPLITGVNDLEIEVAETATISGPQSPSTVADDASGGTIAWTNPGNAASSNNAYATFLFNAGVGTPVTSHWLKATKFGFAIPGTATITDVSTECEAKTSKADAVAEEFNAQLLKAGAAVGSVISTPYALSTEDVYRTVIANLASTGSSVTPAEANAEGFGTWLNIKALGVGEPITHSIDHIRMKVTYIPGSSAYAATARLSVERGYY